MKYLLQVKDEDIFPDTPEYEIDDSWEKRDAVKVILFDKEDAIALAGIRYLLLPGGGVDEGETLEDAVVRECMEEVGCKVEVLEQVGVTKDSRLQNKRIQTTYCFTAKVVGEKGEPQSTQEDEQGMKVEWFSIEDTLALLKDQKETISLLSYNSHFNLRTHIVFLEKYMADKS